VASTAEAQPTAIHASRRKVAPYVCVLAGLLALVVYLVATDPSAGKVAGVIAVASFLVAFGRIFVRRSAVLTIDEQGVRFEHLWGSGHADWPAIEGCSVQPWGIGLSGKSSALALVLRDGSDPHVSLGRRQRRWARRHGFVPISLAFTEAKPDFVLGVLRDSAARAGHDYTVTDDGRGLIRRS
jgi:hypothetical protein